MSGMTVTAPVAAVLARLGLPETDPNLVDVVPTAARGNNLVVVTPPAALHAVPGLAGAISALAARESAILLVLVAEPVMAEWESVISAVAATTGHRVHAARTLARASRRLQAGAIDILLASPEAALALVQRSALKTEQVAAVFMAWPEFWSGEDALAPLMQDIGRETQRIIYTTEQDRVASLVERFARRANTVGPIPGEMPPPEAPAAKPTGPIRIVTCPWTQRDQAVREVIELLDPPASAAWSLTADPDFAPRLPPGTTHAVRRIPPENLVIAYDLPTAAQLVQLAAEAQLVVLVPPTALPWIRRVLPDAKPLRLAGAFDAAGTATHARRRLLADAIEARSAEGGLLALGPLFERYDPATVAAILYELWLERPGAAVTAAITATPVSAPAVAEMPGNATARIWVGVGKKDGATPNDFVGVLTKELKVEKGMIGKIEVRELYSLVEVPAGEAESLANRLTGVSIRRRRVTARLDQGARGRGKT